MIVSAHSVKGTGNDRRNAPVRRPCARFPERLRTGVCASPTKVRNKPAAGELSSGLYFLLVILPGSINAVVDYLGDRFIDTEVIQRVNSCATRDYRFGGSQDRPPRPDHLDKVDIHCDGPASGVHHNVSSHLSNGPWLRFVRLGVARPRLGPAATVALNAACFRTVRADQEQPEDERYESGSDASS